jgi:uncharacterized membrane protein
MAKKFDTNPLDPDFPEKVKARAAGAETPPQEQYNAPPTGPNSPFQTAEFPGPPSSVTEDETRRFAESDFQAYSAPYAAQPPMHYAPANFAEMNTASVRKVGTTGLPEKWLVGLAYLPFSIGFVAGLILLLIIPKEENKVRFHAAQGFAAHVAVFIISAILSMIGNFTDSNFGGFLFAAVTTVMLIVWAIKAWRGKPVHIAALDDLTNWLEEKIGPIKSS